MLYPVLAHSRVSAGQRKAILDHWMREVGRVKVQAQIALARPVDPALEQFSSVLAAFDLAAVELGVAGVQVELLGAGYHAHGQVGVSAQLVCGASAAGVVAGRGYTAAGAGLVAAFKAHDVVTLPAVHRYRYAAGRGERGLHIDAALSVDFARVLVAFYNEFFVPLQSPRVGKFVLLLYHTRTNIPIVTYNGTGVGGAM